MSISVKVPARESAKWQSQTMDSDEASRFSFIIRIWIEEPATEVQLALWRGHIVHVPSGERHYFQSLSEIAVILLPYLKAAGVGAQLDRGLWRYPIGKWEEE